MFDLLKKKIGSFISGLTKKEGEIPKEPQKEIEKPAEQLVQEPAKNIIAQPIEGPKPQKEPVPAKKTVEAESIKETKVHVNAIEQKKYVPKEEKPAPQKTMAKEGTQKPKETAKPVQETAPAIRETENRKTNMPAAQKPKPQKETFTKTQKTGSATQNAKPATMPPETMRISGEIPAKDIEIAQGKGEKKVKQDLGSALTSFITGVVELKEQDVKELLDTLELELLESDVSLEVADTVIKRLKSSLIGKKVKRGGIEHEVKEAIQNTLISIMESDTSQIFSKFEKSPLIIMVCGINGAGKTTTMAKLAHLFMARGKKVCFAASDTFRAAAIEQLDVHAKQLNVPIIKRPYGADPTAVAFDAVQYAKAHGINVILVDTAGRQDTNTNLMNELKKMERVIKPDLKVYVGESLAGNAIIDQVRTFKEEIGLDGVILTKIDCDPKGGTILSIREATDVPILFVGTGQKYEDLHPFDAKEIVKRILE